MGRKIKNALSLLLWWFTFPTIMYFLSFPVPSTQPVLTMQDVRNMPVVTNSTLQMTLFRGPWQLASSRPNSINIGDIPSWQNIANIYTWKIDSFWVNILLNYMLWGAISFISWALFEMGIVADE